MFSTSHFTVVNALQASIAPVTLISAVGFLSLVTSNRYGRVIDRLRVLLRQIQELVAQSPEYITTKQQIDIMFRRANSLRIATIMGGWSIFCTALTIFMLFAHLMFELSFTSHIAVCSFMLSLILLLAFILILIHDFGIALHAVRFEMEAYLSAQDKSKYLAITAHGDEP